MSKAKVDINKKKKSCRITLYCSICQDIDNLPCLNMAPYSSLPKPSQDFKCLQKSCTGFMTCTSHENEYLNDTVIDITDL